MMVLAADMVDGCTNLAIHRMDNIWAAVDSEEEEEEDHHLVAFMAGKLIDLNKVFEKKKQLT